MTDRETGPDDGQEDSTVTDGQEDSTVLEDCVDLYDAATDENGRSRNYPQLEPDPEFWAILLESCHLRDALADLDDLLGGYERSVVAHVAPRTFRTVHLENQPRPDELWLFLVDDYDEFTADVTHPFFGRMDEEAWTRPSGSPLVLRFDDGYRHTLDVPEGFSHLDVKIPTRNAYRQRVIQSVLEDHF